MTVKLWKSPIDIKNNPPNTPANINKCFVSNLDAIQPIPIINGTSNPAQSDASTPTFPRSSPRNSVTYSGILSKYPHCPTYNKINAINVKINTGALIKLGEDFSSI